MIRLLPKSRNSLERRWVILLESRKTNRKVNVSLSFFSTRDDRSFLTATAEATPRKNGKGKATDGEDDRDHKNTDSQFASHLKAAKGASTFSRDKTLKQQRQYLPAFASREALLKVIRENQGSSSFLRSRRSAADLPRQSSFVLERLDRERRLSLRSSCTRKAIRITELSDVLSLVVSQR